MTYTPNPVDGTNPLDTVDISTAAAEFRALKTYLQANGILSQPGDIIWTAMTSGPRPGCLYCNGQAVSRTTYSNLFAAISTQYGAGDGSTTFNVPDLAGRTMFGYDMGNATGRLTGNTSGGINAGAPGNSGGLQSASLVIANLASHNHTITITDPGHTHTITISDPGHNHVINISDPTHTHSVYDPGHTHTLNIGSITPTLNDPGHDHGINNPSHTHTVVDPEHTHSATETPHYHNITDPGHAHGLPGSTLNGSGNVQSGVNFGTVAGNTGTSTTGIVNTNYAYVGINGSINSASTGITLSAATTTISANTATTGLTVNAFTPSVTVNAANTGIANYGASTGITATSNSHTTGVTGANSSSSTGITSTSANTGTGTAFNTLPPGLVLYPFIKT